MRTRLALAVTVALSAAGCADNNASVRVSMICAPPDDATACSFESTCGAETLAPITIDIAKTSNLWLLVQVDNQLPNNELIQNGRVNTNDAWIQTFVIRYDGGAIPESRGFIEGSAFVPASGSAVVSVMAVNANVAPYMTAGSQLAAHLRFIGEYADGTSFETGEFDIPFYVCSGCVPLLSCTTGFPVYCPTYGQIPASATCAT